MSAMSERYVIDEETRAKPLIEEAKTHPVIVQMNGSSYEVNVRDISATPYTLESVYGSLPPLRGRKGSEISNEELERMIDQAKEENVRHIFEDVTE